LQKEVSVKRIPVSQAAADLIKHIQEHQDGDPLLKGGRGSEGTGCACVTMWENVAQEMSLPIF